MTSRSNLHSPRFPVPFGETTQKVSKNDYGEQDEKTAVMNGVAVRMTARRRTALESESAQRLQDVDSHRRAGPEDMLEALAGQANMVIAEEERLCRRSSPLPEKMARRNRIVIDQNGDVLVIGFPIRSTWPRRTPSASVSKQAHPVGAGPRGRDPDVIQRIQGRAGLVEDMLTEISENGVRFRQGSPDAEADAHGISVDEEGSCGWWTSSSKPSACGLPIFIRAV